MLVGGCECEAILWLALITPSLSLFDAVVVNQDQEINYSQLSKIKLTIGFIIGSRKDLMERGPHFYWMEYHVILHPTQFRE